MKLSNLLRCFQISASVMAVSVARAAEPPESSPEALPPAGGTIAADARPATQPAPPATEALIAQLGDDKFAKRAEAAESLKKLGNEALPALEQAATSTNPQIRISAQALIGEITGATKSAPKPVAVDPFQPHLRLRQGQVQIRNLPAGGVHVARMQVNMIVNGQLTREMTVEENGRKVHIREDGDGIKMEVTEKGETKETTAKTAAELKANSPEAFKLYEAYNGIGPGGLRIDAGVRP